MKARSRLICAAAGIALCVAAPAAAETMKMKVAALGTADNPINKCAPVAIAEEIAARSDGRITAEMYLGGTAFANPTKLYEQVERGITDYTWAVLSYTPGRFGLTEIAGLPLLVSDQVVAARVLNENLEKYLADEFKGVHVLALAVISPNQLHLRQPVATIDELKGKRIRTASGVIADAVNAMGADAVSMPVTEQYESLQRGVIDGSLAPMATVAAFRLAEVTKAHVTVNLGTTLGVLALSNKFYDSLPDDLKTMIDTEFSGPEIGARISDCWNKVGNRARTLIEEAGNEVVDLDAGEQAKMEALVKPVVEEALAELEASGKPARGFYETLKNEIAAASR
ncbi:MAG: TRAP transporter substrate-binding protein [Parvibaculum sp.]|uniref:TRAP transporter substrate-binding protein n=1 Tax=Parvibaculum sp. TaxID=2024848 RepID=UPI0032976FC6